MSEFDIIQRLLDALPELRDDVVIGPGDDGAVLAVPPGHELVVTTDTLVAGRHFPADTSACDIAYKALAVNLSDLAAMAAEPAWLTVALTLPDRDSAWLAGFADGLAQALQQSGASLVGGDLTRGPLSICVQAAGLVAAGMAMRRNGARPGDAICVTGTLGDAALGLTQWQDGRRAQDAQRAFLHDRLVRPQPRNRAAAVVAGKAHAGLDISDGLAADLGHILAASGVGACIDAARLPASAAFAALCPANRHLQLQLAGGDDYELCLCLPEQDVATLARDMQAACACPLTQIGSVEAQSGLRMVDAQGRPVATGPAGYDHFA